MGCNQKGNAKRCPKIHLHNNCSSPIPRARSSKQNSVIRRVIVDGHAKLAVNGAVCIFVVHFSAPEKNWRVVFKRNFAPIFGELVFAGVDEAVAEHERVGQDQGVVVPPLLSWPLEPWSACPYLE